WMFLSAFDDGNSHTLTLYALVGDADALSALARAARSEAAYRGYPNLEAIAADDPTIHHALERAGFTRESGMLICEQIL
ncbi:MAG: hypothetical protein HZC40_00470, partial [Chloroflexi bacterium]|nr:hypothetical protein [Chloroflexota bacterium]